MSAVSHEENQPKKKAPHEGRHDVKNAVQDYHLARDPEREIERLRSMLFFLDPDVPRDEWIRAGMAAKAAGIDADDWHEWSRGGATYDEQDATDAWDSFDATGKVTGATLARMARDAGWTESATGAPPRSSRPTTSAKPGRTSEEIHAVWDRFAPASADHPYLARKGIKADGLRVVPAGDPLPIKGTSMAGWLAVPARTLTGELTSIQFIPPDGGGKLNLPGARISGSVFLFGEIAPGGRLFLAEGLATAWAVHKATGDAAVCVFGWGSVGKVASACRGFHPGTRIILCPDVDKTEAGSKLAAELGAGIVVMPADIGPHGDAWDLIEQRGADALLALIPAHEPRTAHEAGDNVLGATVVWPDPQSLTTKMEAVLYPKDALPPAILAAVAEVAAFVKAPVEMIAACALSAVSMAVQGHVDVRRANKLQGPSGIFALTIADSGERKTTCDGFFTQSIRAYQAEQAEVMKPEIERFAAEKSAWEAEREGVLLSIKAAGKGGKDTASMRAKLQAMEHTKPLPPRVPNMLLGDETPENLAFGLAHRWPSVGIVSSEAGTIFGSHGMGKDSAMRNMSLLNVLWDGGEISIGRRTSESFTVRGARLTMGLQVQEQALREFFSERGELARGSGFLARFLFSWPTSTQGTRFFTEAPRDWPALTAFNRRITQILALGLPITDGALSPEVLDLSPAAKAAWIAFHDDIEEELTGTGELRDVRDVASKTADNAARLAALFHFFEHGANGEISADTLVSASRITAWHLNEARRFLGEFSLPPEMADAGRLDAWLIDYCKRERVGVVPTRQAQQFGPLRDKQRLTAALTELSDLGRVSVATEGKRRAVIVNPLLISGAAP